MRKLAILIVFACTAFGQRHKLEEVDAEKPEGKLLQQIMQESDAAKKTTLMEQFATEFPKLETTAWVLEQLQGVYVKANDADKIISAGQRLLTLDPDDPEAALQALKAAEAKKDIPLVISLSDKTAANARKMAAKPQPAEADQVETWKHEIEYAKQVGTYADYALFRAAAETRDPKQVIQLAELLEQRSPTSEYLPKTRDILFVAYRQANANDKAVALAEKLIAGGSTNEDMLLVVVDNYAQNKKEPEKIHSYSTKIVEVMGSKPKPEGVSDADWTNRKNLVTGLAYYMNGKQYSVEAKYPQADKELRSALPLVEGNANMKAEVLFLLGFANSKMGTEKQQDAANYFRACAAMQSPFKAQAAKNLAVIQQQYRGIK
jgi:tetratricopeptide (TPR) repeat protein